MRAFRNRMLIGAKKITAATMKDDVVKAIEGGKQPGPNLREQLYNDFKKEKSNIFWLCAVLLLLILEGINYLIFFVISPWNSAGVIIGTVFFAFFLGAAILFFFSAKAVTGLLGGLVGIEISEAGTAAGLISKANEAITDIATQIGIIVSDPTNETGPAPLIVGAVWIFVIILTVTCGIPAFGRAESGKGNKSQ